MDKGTKSSRKSVKICFYRSHKRENKNAEASIYCRLTLNGVRTEISTSIYLKKSEFVNGNTIPRNQKLKSYQRQLDIMKTRLIEIETDLKVIGGAITPHNIKNIFITKNYNKKFYFFEIAEDWLEHRKKLIGVDFGENVHNSTKKTIERFKTFLKQKYNRTDLSCAEITTIATKL